MTTTSWESGRSQSAPLLACIVGAAGAIAVLTLAGRGALAAPSVLDPGAWSPWAQTRDALTIAFSVLRLLTLAVAWYLLAVTVIGGVARLARWQRLVTVTDVLTVPAVRRLLQSAFGLGLATAALTIGSPSTTPASPPVPAATLPMTAQTEAPRAAPIPWSPSSPSIPPPVPVPAAAEMVGPDTGSPDPAPTDDGWTVEAGDHFWSIAAHVLAAAWGRPPTDAEIVGYWKDLIADNAARLVDPGNPDLIVPGQTISLPRPPMRP